MLPIKLLTTETHRGQQKLFRNDGDIEFSKKNNFRPSFVRLLYKLDAVVQLVRLLHELDAQLGPSCTLSFSNPMQLGQLPFQLDWSNCTRKSSSIQVGLRKTSFIQLVRQAYELYDRVQLVQKSDKLVGNSDESWMI